jgi:hypothetical protein
VRAEEAHSGDVEPVAGDHLRRRMARRGRFGAPRVDSVYEEGPGGEAKLQGLSPEQGEARSGGGGRYL